LTNSLPSDLAVNFSDIEKAALCLKNVAHKTPVFTSRTVNQQTGAEVFFKCENLQRGGAFKFRGAYNAIKALSAQKSLKGVVAFSSGNHAQAVALAGREMKLKVVIVMPQDAPAVKITATRGYGAEVVLYDRAHQDREQITRDLAQSQGLEIVPPFDDAMIVAGQGTATKELIEEVGALDYLLVPCGGGGLLSGSAIAAQALSPGVRCIGVEPEAGDDVTRSFRSGSIQSVHNPDTIADGARTSAPGIITFPLILHYVQDMLTVSDPQLLRTMFYLWERMKIMVEPTGALGAAALMEGLIDVHQKRVGVILSGGNADIKDLSRFLV
jgi:threonine dehydratase